MKLLTAEILNKMPSLYSQEEKGLDAKVIVKFFDPQGGFTWYASEATAITDQIDENGNNIEKVLKDILPDDNILDIRFYGLVDGLEKELGYFSFNELKAYNGRLGLGIERDMYFDNQPLKNFM